MHLCIAAGVGSLAQGAELALVALRGVERKCANLEAFV
jgi:hypothetical protein